MSPFLDGSPDPRGRILLLIHGAGGHGALWDGVRAHLPHGIPAAAVDLPGHGRSEGRPCDSIAAAAEVVARAVRRAGASAFVAVGHSLGGAVALTLGARRTPGLCGVGAVSTGPRLPVDGRIFRGLDEAFGPTVDRITRACLAKGAPAAHREGLVRPMIAAGPTVLRADFAACHAYGLEARDLEAIAVPTAVVCGREDVMTPPELSREVARAVPGARLVLLPSCGHVPLLECPKDLATALAELWELAFPGG